MPSPGPCMHASMPMSAQMGLGPWPGEPAAPAHPHQKAFTTLQGRGLENPRLPLTFPSPSINQLAGAGQGRAGQMAILSMIHPTYGVLQQKVTQPSPHKHCSSCCGRHHLCTTVKRELLLLPPYVSRVCQKFTWSDLNQEIF